MASLSYQLFSSRNYDLHEILGLLQSLGIKEVEGFGPFYDDPAYTKATLDKYDLSMPTGHFSIDMIEGTPERTIEIAKTLGTEAVIVPYLMPDDRPKTSAEWAAFGQRLAQAGEKIVAAGFKFGWHNHDFEFQACEDGSFPIEHILAGADFIQLELDIAWVHVAGQDPLAWLERLKDRIIAVHAKDRAPKGENADEDGWADLGHGEMDWTAISAKLKEIGVPRYVLEHDNPSDQTRFATRSVATAKSF